MISNHGLDSVYFMIGLVSWLMALFSFIVDEIFTLADFVEDNGGEQSISLEVLNRKGHLNRLFYPY